MPGPLLILKRKQKKKAWIISTILIFTANQPVLLYKITVHKTANGMTEKKIALPHKI